MIPPLPPAAHDVRLFAYGELCKPAVLVELIGRVPLAEPALLHGYRRELVRETGYYLAIPRDGASIAGLLFDELGAAELLVLDRYEDVAGGEYERRELEVERLISGSREPAFVYVSRPW